MQTRLSSTAVKTTLKLQNNFEVFLWAIRKNQSPAFSTGFDFSNCFHYQPYHRAPLQGPFDGDHWKQRKQLLQLCI